MTHKAKIDWWIPVALILGALAPLAFGKFWMTVPLFLAVGICGYPQHYETSERGLVIHAGLTRRVIPYEAITFIGPSEESSIGFALSLDRVAIRHGAGAGEVIAPSNYRAFLADMERRAPQLKRRGQDLVLGYA